MIRCQKSVEHRENGHTKLVEFCQRYWLDFFELFHHFRDDQLFRRPDHLFTPDSNILPAKVADNTGRNGHLRFPWGSCNFRSRNLRVDSGRFWIHDRCYWCSHIGHQLCSCSSQVCHCGLHYERLPVGRCRVWRGNRCGEQRSRVLSSHRGKSASSGRLSSKDYQVLLLGDHQFGQPDVADRVVVSS